MLTRILDTFGIDIDDPEIKHDLETDLRRMDAFKHKDVPEGADVYRVIVKPSSKTYSSGLYRFTFEIQYGNIVDGNFEGKEEILRYQTETLPMI